MAAVGGHAVEARRDRFDAPSLRRPPQRGQGEIGADVFAGRVLAVDRDMRDAQVVVQRRVRGIDVEELGGGVVAARGLIALVRLIGRRRGDDRDAALPQRLSERMERRLRVMRPAIRRAIPQGGIVSARALDIGDRRILLGSETEVGFFAHPVLLRQTVIFVSRFSALPSASSRRATASPASMRQSGSRTSATRSSCTSSRECVSSSGAAPVSA